MAKRTQQRITREEHEVCDVCITPLKHQNLNDVPTIMGVWATLCDDCTSKYASSKSMGSRWDAEGFKLENRDGA